VSVVLPSEQLRRRVLGIRNGAPSSVELRKAAAKDSKR
jgi:hypothetical protein